MVNNDTNTLFSCCCGNNASHGPLGSLGQSNSTRGRSSEKWIVFWSGWKLLVEPSIKPMMFQLLETRKKIWKSTYRTHKKACWTYNSEHTTKTQFIIPTNHKTAIKISRVLSHIQPTSTPCNNTNQLRTEKNNKFHHVFSHHLQQHPERIFPSSCIQIQIGFIASITLSSLFTTTTSIMSSLLSSSHTEIDSSLSTTIIIITPIQQPSSPSQFPVHQLSLLLLLPHTPLSPTTTRKSYCRSRR